MNVYTCSLHHLQLLSYHKYPCCSTEHTDLPAHPTGMLTLLTQEIVREIIVIAGVDQMIFR
jgi:hypothetical protein